ncbi:MAG: hypothetical protein ACRCZF_14065 [Gemmataceae bacterium]
MRLSLFRGRHVPLLVALFFPVLGCNADRPVAGPAPAPTQTTKAGETQNKVPRPELSLIEYDTESRTLILYDLNEENARWMLVMPGQSMGIPVNAIHQFQDDVEPDLIQIFFTTSAGLASPRVSLGEILRSRPIPASR